MSYIDDAIRIELFNDRIFMDGAATVIRDKPFDRALPIAMDLIESTAYAEFERTRFSPRIMRTVCWWALGDMDLRSLAVELLEILGVR